MNNVYVRLKEFKRKHPGGISWRLRKHAKIIDMHLNPGEELLYVFPAQKNFGIFEWFDTYAVALTNKRILLGRKRLLWGYVLSSVTPDMYNDMQVYQGLIWGKITIDTIKEQITLTNLPKYSLNEIETNITEYMMEQKKLYPKKEED